MDFKVCIDNIPHAIIPPPGATWAADPRQDGSGFPEPQSLLSVCFGTTKTVCKPVQYK